ncbi:hypothetical protein C0Q70_02446 [Pomacea canaliculata]|uniref:C-type lectin domain-containing protein n=1 Tax=Pomacea canaliculata TaxID=400727 RepID=A0A2T7PPY3_POMCA|nr:hypothetical protein C0Q70_02446 [Pomacea canaliculata]
MTPWNVYPTKLEHHVDEDLNRTDIIDAQDEKPMTPGGPMDVNSKMSDLEQTVNEEEQQYANSLRTSYVKQEQCHVGWNQLTKFKCYKYMDSAATWYDAKLQCQKMDSSLVTFETGDELSVVHEHYGFLIVGIGAWTGLRNDGQLTWDSNHTIQEEFLESALGTGGLEGIAQKRGCFYLQKSDEKKFLVHLRKKDENVRSCSDCHGNGTMTLSSKEHKDGDGVTECSGVQVLQFIQLVQPVDRVSAQVVVLWLLLLEALTAPHVLWVLSRRYRHALVYVWTVHVLRDTSAKEEDPSACTLQSYTRRVQAPGGATVRVTARVRRGVTITGPVHEYQTKQSFQLLNPMDKSGPIREKTTPRDFPPTTLEQARRGAEIITTDLDDDLTVITDIASTKKRYIYHSPASERAAQASLQRPEAAEGSGGSSQTTSPSRLSVNSPTRPFDMRRSGSAREAWKEQMRKKHLPAVFVNDAFDAEEEGERGQDLVSDMHVLPDVALVGGDFDERSDGAPRVESESDGSSFQYDDRDIEIILDGHHGLHSGGSRSVLEKVVEAEAPRESNDDPVPHFAATTEGVLKDGYLGRVDSYGDSSEGSSTEKQSVRGRKKPPRRSSRTNRSDGTEEARAWTLQGEGLKQGADEFVGREFFLYEADQSKQMPAYEMQNDFNQYSSSVELDKEGFRKNFSRVPESVNPGLVSVAFSKNDFVKLQNITSDSTDADNIPDNVSVTSTVKVSGDKNSSNKANKVLMKDVFKDEFDEVAPHNPRKRTEVMDKDFDDVDEPRGTPTGNSVISAPWTLTPEVGASRTVLTLVVGLAALTSGEMLTAANR